MSEPTCESCRFWVPEIFKPEGVEHRVGFCRRRAPVVDGYTRFPSTMGVEWCGEYEPKAAGEDGGKAIVVKRVEVPEWAQEAMDRAIREALAKKAAENLQPKSY